MRWVLVLLSIAGFFAAFLSRTPGLLGLCLLLGFACAIAAVFAFAHARIEGNARPETLNEADLLAYKATLSTNSSAAQDRTQSLS